MKCSARIWNSLAAHLAAAIFQRLVEKRRYAPLVFRFCHRMRFTVFGAGYQPQLFRLAGVGEVLFAVLDRHCKVVQSVDDEDRPRADARDDIHGTDRIDVDSRALVRDPDGDGRERERWKMNEMFEAGGDYTRRVAESAIVHDRLDALVPRGRYF